MKMKTRVVPGLALLVAGFFCLNYTKAFGVDHHFEWAEETGLPAPSGTIHFLGIGLMAVGGVVVGMGVGRRE